MRGAKLASQTREMANSTLKIQVVAKEWQSDIIFRRRFFEVIFAFCSTLFFLATTFMQRDGVFDQVGIQV